LTTVSFASRAVDATTSDATGLIGIASGTVATGAAVLVNVYGTASCVFEGATAAGDYFQASPTVAGNCRDVGPSYPATNQVLGFVLSSNGTAGTYTVFLFGVEIRASAAAPVTSVFNRAGAVTAAAHDYNFNQLAGSLVSAQDYTVGSSGTYTKLTTNSQGRVSSGSQAAASDLSNGTTGSGVVVLETAPTIASPSLSAPSLGTTAQTSTYISNGSTVNLLQILTTVSSSSRAANAATATTGVVVGIAQSTISAGGSVEVATSGKATCQFDATAVTSGDYVQISSVTAGDCHDAGSVRPGFRTDHRICHCHRFGQHCPGGQALRWRGDGSAGSFRSGGRDFANDNLRLLHKSCDFRTGRNRQHFFQWQSFGDDDGPVGRRRRSRMQHGFRHFREHDRGGLRYAVP
jgi:hypothetical protein